MDPTWEWSRGIFHMLTVKLKGKKNENKEDIQDQSPKNFRKIWVLWKKGAVWQ